MQGVIMQKIPNIARFLGLQVVQSQHDEDEYLIMQPINKEELEQYGYLCEQETQDTDPKIHQGIIDE